MTDTDPPDSSLPGLDLGEPRLAHEGTAPPLAAAPYRVLARKYRPVSFDDMIGQDAMVRTLTNAFAIDRIHQAYILTGVRGVGKTTTARILARAFNYYVPGRIDRPTVDMPEFGVHCQAIIESRHMDVIEMDAASHTSIEDVREIIENVRYLPVSARYKVYIIDEVHMLSKSAFNALLKTLEEPPPHVKFLFATTEIEKVPITIRSRCIRFDLKRIEAGLMVKHLAKICRSEKVEADEEALALIARVAEGSVRDSLSLLDQGIAHSASERVRVEDVREMLGLSDRGDVIALFGHAMRGEIGEALELVARMYHAGADAAEMLIELAEFCHLVTRIRVANAPPTDPSISEIERTKGLEFAQTLALGQLTRAWAMLFKGVEDVKDSPRPLASLEMALIRLAYAADLPGPEEAMRKIIDGGGLGAPRAAAPASGPPTGAPRALAVGQAAPAARVALAPAPAAGPRLESLPDLVALARTKRDVQLVNAIERELRIGRFEPGRMEFSLADGASPALAQTLTRKLTEWTGDRWLVAIVQGVTTPTLAEVAAAREAEKLDGLAAHPLVRKVLERFPGAKIVPREPEAITPPAAAAEPDADFAYVDESAVDEDF
jgi:DNA polymerase III subunit gamma/tau